MSQIASCSRAAIHGLSRHWQSAVRPAAVLTRSRPTVTLPSSRHFRRTFSSGQPDSDYESSSRDVAEASASRLANHLNNVFSPLKFPPELATRVLTHSSHRDASVSNNARISFIGRRVLNSYLMLFLHSAPSLESSHDYELIAERTLNTYILGEHVAPKWELGRVLKWSPVKVDPEVDSADGDFSRLSPKVSRSVGLYKVQGSAVEAVVGGIYHQHGGDITHRIFHTRILPHILLPGTAIGLNDVFHEHAMRVCDQMGGLEADLVVEKVAAIRLESSSAQPRGSTAIP